MVAPHLAEESGDKFTMTSIWDDVDVLVVVLPEVLQPLNGKLPCPVAGTPAPLPNLRLIDAHSESARVL